MLINQFKIIIRNLKRAPLYFFINLMGLSIGFTSSIILLHYAYFESNYDTFHDNVSNKYRIVVKDDGGRAATTPVPTGALINKDFNQVEDYVTLRKANGIVKTIKEGESISDTEERIIMASNSFFDMFSFELISGNTKNLEHPNFAYITEDMAVKYFGTVNALGNEIAFFDRNFGELPLEVAGVIKNPPLNTHIPVSMVVSLNTIEDNDQFWAKFDNWGWNDFYTYIELSSGSTITQQESNEFIDRYIGTENRERAGIQVELQPIGDIHTESGLMYGYAAVRDQRIITFLKIVGAFVLFMACINYVNLAGANGLKRAREVGVRKNLGASRFDVIRQFASESLALNVLALLLATTLIQLSWPFLSNAMGGAFKTSFWNFDTHTVFILIPIVAAIIWTTIQPALIISNFSMIKVLKGNISAYGKGKVYRKGSIVLQFTVSLTLMITSYVIYNQIRYLQNKDLGINIDRKLIITKPGEAVADFDNKADLFKNQLKDLAIVENVSYSGSVPTKGFNYSTNGLYRVDKGPNKVGEYGIYITYIDNDFIKIYQPKILSGVVENLSRSSDLKAIINEKALDPLQIETVSQAVGMMISNGEMEVEIIGVIDDYQHNSVKDESKPVLYLFDKNPQHFTVLYNGGEDALKSTEKVLSEVESLYSSVFPDTNFNYSFLDQEFKRQYRFERFFGNVVLAFTVLAVFLAVVGLFGLSMFDMERKTKEVGIRKTLGASSFGLFLLNIRPFTKLLVLACIAALPIGYYLSQNWLADYTYKTSLEAIVFIIPIVVLFFVTIFTVSYHLVSLNNTNPVDSLRYE